MATLTLEIVPTGKPIGTVTTYRVRDDQGRLVFATRSYNTPEGTEGARGRLRAWCRKTGNKLVMLPAEQRKAG